MQTLDFTNSKDLIQILRKKVLQETSSWYFTCWSRGREYWLESHNYGFIFTLLASSERSEKMQANFAFSSIFKRVYLHVHVGEKRWRNGSENRNFQQHSMLPNSLFVYFIKSNTSFLLARQICFVGLPYEGLHLQHCGIGNLGFLSVELIRSGISIPFKYLYLMPESTDT